tara:strand:+ start:513 stop:716 length:204 start_codon:yes stop_codon:yes gene_type:complete
MSDTNRYKLLELSTNGWSLIDNKAQNLTKEECDVWIQKAMNNGVAQSRLKVARTEDPRYPENFSAVE